MKRYEKKLNHDFFQNKSIIQNNCFYQDNNYYEFIVNNNAANILCNSDIYLNEAIVEFRKYNKHATKFIYKNEIIKTFNDITTITLPINILHPSKIYIDKVKLDDCLNRLEIEEFIIPIATINDKVIILDGHTKVKALELSNIKTVKVYEDKANSFLLDCLFLTESQNINKITDLQVLANEDYQNIWIDFCDNYNKII